MGEPARNLREVPRDREHDWMDVLESLQSSAATRLKALAEDVPCEQNRFTEACQQLDIIFQKFTRLMEMIYHLRSTGSTGSTAGYFHERSSGGLINCLLQDSVQEVVRAMIYEFSFSNVTLLKIIPHDLEPVRMPQEHLDMILFQLIENARRALGGQPGIITIEAREEIVLSPENRSGRRLYLRVSDTGPGIPIPEMPYLFEPFYLGSEGNAHGLGLFTVKKITELYRGTIRVESSVRGTSFYLELPC
jgi:two-component system, NtrC family, sensor kinase